MDRHQLRRLRRAAEAPLRPRPVMNVTPLVDVVLVLLIVFMVVIPALQQGLQIELAGVRNVDDPARTKGTPYILSITRDNLLYFENSALSPSALEQRLRTAKRAQPGRAVVIRADKSAEYTQVRAIYRIAQQAGFPGVSLRVNRQAGQDSP